MTRQQAFDDIMVRMQKPENQEKYYAISLSPQEADQPLCWHLERARISLKAIQDGDGKIELFKSDFDVSIRTVGQILDKQGWV